ncbi:MAG: trigger factor [Acidimicrobiales bacterium]|nr:trigger factor [Acidimicrobiales bacterium]RZV47379.1 MAG: trigger factor [Acidimicrobiales bacterium]
MNTTLETLDDNMVKLSVTIDEAEFEPQLDEAYKRISKEVRMPGFRPGKVPRKLLEQQFGPEMAREEAMRIALPDYYSQAVDETEVDVIASPEIEITDGQASGPITFEAVVEVRPVVTIAGHGGLRVEVVSPLVTDEDVQERLDSIRRQHSTLETVERAAAESDHVTIDIEGTIDGEPVPGLTAEDYDYVVGSGAVVKEIDENVEGASAGDELTFSADHPSEDEDSQIDFVIKVKDVNEQVLPEPTDEFAQEASEFETIAELKADLTDRLADSKKAQAAMQVEEKIGESLAQLITDDLSDAVIENEMDNRAQEMAMRLQAQGIGLEQYLQITGTTPEMFREQLREQAEVSARVDLALRAVIVAESVEVSDEDLDHELLHLAAQVDQPLADVKEQLEQSGRLQAVRSDMRVRAALDWVIERAEIVDEDGNSIDRELLKQPEHDHDHGSEEE